MSLDLPSYYLAAVVPEELRRGLCGLCRTPISQDYNRCYPCSRAPSQALPDLVGFTSYAIRGKQAATEMHRYKDQLPSAQAVNGVRLLLDHGLAHLGCAERLTGQEIDAVAVMPSRSHYEQDRASMLQRMCAQALPPGLPRLDLQPSQGAASTRRVEAGAFQVGDCQGVSHVLLIDDTWVSGGTVMSATVALRSAGATRVSALVLARWLDKGYGYPVTKSFVDRVTREQGWCCPSTKCPFTLDGRCPPTAPSRV